MRTCAAITALGLLLLAAPVAARADTTSATPWAEGVSAGNQKKALSLFREGNTYFERSEYAQALERYRVAVEVWDHPAIHFNIAVCLINLDKPIVANEHLERALRYNEAPLGGSLYAQGLTYRKLLDGRLARLHLVTDQEGVLITLDGNDLLVGPGEKTLVLLPGPHQLVAKRTYLPPHTRVLDLPAGTLTTERVVMTRLERRWAPWLPWAVAGSGLAIGLVGFGLELKAISTFDEYDRQLARTCPTGCAAEELPPELRDRGDRARLENTLAVTALAVGGAAIAAGVAMFVFNQPRPVEAERRLEIRPSIGPDGAGVTATVPF